MSQQHVSAARTCHWGEDHSPSTWPFFLIWGLNVQWTRRSQDSQGSSEGQVGSEGSSGWEWKRRRPWSSGLSFICFVFSKLIIMISTVTKTMCPNVFLKEYAFVLLIRIPRDTVMKLFTKLGSAGFPQRCSRVHRWTWLWCLPTWDGLRARAEGAEPQGKAV